MGHLLNFVAGPSLALLFQLGTQGQEGLAASCGTRNAVVNGGFEAGISSWSAAAGFGSSQWIPEGADYSPTSGSLRLVNNSAPSGRNASVSQCDAIQGGVSYDLGAKIQPVNYCCVPAAKRPLAVRHTGSLYVLLNFYPKAS
ncbi:MAG: hypothetical protein ABJC61_04415 [Acidobacteriota bacterium]